MEIKILGHTINYEDKHLKSLSSREYINKASVILMRHVAVTKIIRQFIKNNESEIY